MITNKSFKIFVLLICIYTVSHFFQNDFSSSFASDSRDIIDSSTMYNKVMFGYQGWFKCEGDGYHNKWHHWFKNGGSATSNLRIDFWPDLSEFPADELYKTNITINGKPAPLFSSANENTVVRHFKWMKDNSLDGVFLQRFYASFDKMKHIDKVANNVKVASEKNGRVFALMYDISIKQGGNGGKWAQDSWVEAIKKDWIHLVDDLKITSTDRYLKHKGKPILALWGIAPDRMTSKSVIEAVDWFKNRAPEQYKVTLMCGTNDNDWKSKGGEWAKIYNSFDVMSPWAVGRYKNNQGADNFKNKFIVPEIPYCKSNNMDYMPVIFPGSSAHNQERNLPLNNIRRNGGDFLWRQSYNAISAGSNMIYIAMFDEVDEGTAMFKIVSKKNETPASNILALDADGFNLPSDWYLRLSNEIGKVLRKEKSNSSTMPLDPKNAMNLPKEIVETKSTLKPSTKETPEPILAENKIATILPTSTPEPSTTEPLEEIIEPETIYRKTTGDSKSIKEIESDSYSENKSMEEEVILEELLPVPSVTKDFKNPTITQFDEDIQITNKPNSISKSVFGILLSFIEMIIQIFIKLLGVINF